MCYAITRNGETVCIFANHARAKDAFIFYASEYPQHKWLVVLAP